MHLFFDEDARLIWSIKSFLTSKSSARMAVEASPPPGTLSSSISTLVALIHNGGSPVEIAAGFLDKTPPPAVDARFERRGSRKADGVATRPDDGKQLNLMDVAGRPASAAAAASETAEDLIPGLGGSGVIIHV